MKLHESCIARRRFLCSMLGGGTVALGAAVAAPLVQYVGDFRDEPLPEFLALPPADGDLAPGTAKMVSYGRVPVLLLKPAGSGELKVFVATCTHLNCTVAYQRAENRIFCACHEGYYDTDGQVVAGPPPRPLRQLYSKRVGDKFIIAMEKDKLEKAS